MIFPKNLDENRKWLLVEDSSGDIYYRSFSDVIIAESVRRDMHHPEDWTIYEIMVGRAVS